MPKQNRRRRKGNPHEDPRNPRKDESGEKPAGTEYKFNNDFAWYALNPELITAACSVAFGVPSGSKLPRPGVQHQFSTDASSVTTDTTSANDHDEGYVGLTVVKLISTIGSTSDPTHNIADVAAKAIYAWVRHENSGKTNYECPDLMMYLLAMRDVYSLCGWMLRMYAILNTYSETNRFMGRQLARALGADYDNFMENIADFKYFVSAYFRRVDSLCVPADMPIFFKAFWIYSQLFAEDKTSKTQIYAFNPRNIKVWDPTTYTTGSALIPGANWNINWTFANFRVYADAILAALLNDEDVGIMSGDIKKAYTNLFKLGAFPADVTIKPVVDSYVLQIIHNATIPDSWVSEQFTDRPVVQSASGEILHFPGLRLARAANTSHTARIPTNHLLDIDAEAPSKEEVCEALTLKTAYKTFYYSKSGSTPDSSNGLLNSYYFVTDGQYPVNEVGYVADGPCDYVVAAVEVTLLDETGFTTTSVKPQDVASGGYPPYIYSQLEWLPLGEYVFYGTHWGVVGTLHNLTVVADSVIKNAHEAQLMSLFGVPKK